MQRLLSISKTGNNRYVQPQLVIGMLCFWVVLSVCADVAQGLIDANSRLRQDQLRLPQSHGNGSISDGADFNIVAPDAPPGFSGNLHAQVNTLN